MTTEQILFFGVLGAMLVLFVWGRWRYDLVALCALLVLAVAGVVPVERAFLGFAHPAVITVAAVFVVSRGLLNAGVIDLLGKALSRAGEGPTRQVGALSGATALVSGFVNNIGALAVLMPVAIRAARKAKESPSYLLMPLAFASSLGGLVTLIGTPSNIIIATFRGDAVGVPFGMFDFTPVGAGVVLAGLLLILVAWRLVPRRKGQATPDELFAVEEYLTELRVREESEAVGKSLREVMALAEDGIQIVGLVRRGRRLPAPSPSHILQPDDVVIVEASSEDLEGFVDAAKLELVGRGDVKAEALGSEEVEVMEAVVLPDARLVGKTPRQLNLRVRYGLNLVAVARQGAPVRDRLRDVRFRSGDILLVQGPRDRLLEALAALGCMPLVERDLRLGKPRNAMLALGVFGAGVAAVSLGLLRVDVGFVAVAAVLVLLGLLSLREAYESVDWSVIVLLGALIPVGEVLETTGGAAGLADFLVAFGVDLPAWGVVGLLLVVALLLSNLIDNAATAVLLAPVAIAVAGGMDASVDPFLMAVAVGASCGFLTPIGQGSNTLVWGPGGYRFGDYWRLGLPLSLLVVAVAIPLILVVWPL